MNSDPHPAVLTVEELLKQCRVKRTRGRGPGGQHRNKVETAVVVTHLPSGLNGQASERRNQQENLAMAVNRLRLNLAVSVRRDISQAVRPSSLWDSRVKSRRISVSATHRDFPALLAEAVDFIAFFEFDVAKAAQELRISTSQLAKFVQAHPPAARFINQMRLERGLRKII